MDRRGLPLLCCLALAGCSSALDQETGKGNLPVNVRQFHPRLLEIAAGYEAYGRVDDELRWAPELCRQPLPSQPRASMSSDVDTHGRKLYYIFAADRVGYLGRNGKDPGAVGQVVVKEAWSIEEVPADTPYSQQESPVRYLKQDGHLYHAASKGGLFIMYRLAQETPDTDLGWVYGTVAADGKTVTSAGRVGSCMGCHEQATKGRLFGIDYHGA